MHVGVIYMQKLVHQLYIFQVEYILYISISTMNEGVAETPRERDEREHVEI